MPDKEHLPVPDPTVLTQQQMTREIWAAREILETRIVCLEELLERIQLTADQQISLREAAVGHLQSLQDEKFRGIQTQFEERDIRTEQTQRDSKVAVDAALQAAKEAVGEQNKSSALAIAKSEASTTKQIDQISVIINAMAKALDDKIDDIKGRLNAIEGHGKGTNEIWGYIIGALGVLMMLGTLLVMGFKK
jgi:tetrahydromethanopterin S-methyltransferase subunit B